MKDRQSLGGKEFTYYYNHMPIDDFLTLKGNPVVEDIENESKSEKIKDFIEDLYARLSVNILESFQTLNS